MSQIRALAEQVSTREGCYLYDIEFVGAGQGRVLRVTIDKDGESGVSVEDCTNVSRGLNLVLDVEDVVPGGAYSLEVSSPGLERVLKEPRHFERAIGQKVLARTFQPLAQFNENLPPELSKAKQVQGVLNAADGQGLRFEYAGPKGDLTEIFVPMESVTKAHIVYEFADPSEKKKSLNLKKGKAKS